MAEVGLGLAIVSAVAQTFTGIVTSYRFLLTARGLKSDAPILFVRLQMQEVRFKVLGRYWKMDNGKFDNFLEKEDLCDNTLAILKHIEALLNNTKDLEHRYGIERNEERVAGRVLAQSYKRGILTGFRWALTDKVKFELLVNTLKEFNDGLFQLFQLSELLSLSRVVQSDVLQTANQEPEINLIQDACIAEGASASASSTKLRPRNRMYNELHDLARTKALHLRIESEQSLPPLGTPMPYLPPSHLRRAMSCLTVVPNDTPSYARVLGTYQPTQSTESSTVLVEWKDYDPEGSYQYKISHRVDSLARLLSDENPRLSDSRLLHCTAYVEDSQNHRFGFLYRLPSNTKAEPPTNLFQLLAGGLQITKPNLGEKFALAQSLALSFMRLHDCGWTHGAVRSSNIVFFNDEGPLPLLYSLHQPYIMGTIYSRPTDADEQTLEYSQSNTENDLYRHPSVSSLLDRTLAHESYRQEHDLYSLGVVLLEIGLWKQIRSLWKEKYTLNRFMQKLIQGYVPILGPTMGVVYRDVVKASLELDLNRYVEDTDFSSNRNEMYWRVIHELEMCRA